MVEALCTTLTRVGTLICKILRQRATMIPAGEGTYTVTITDSDQEAVRLGFYPIGRQHPNPSPLEFTLRVTTETVPDLRPTLLITRGYTQSRDFGWTLNLKYKVHDYRNW